MKIALDAMGGDFGPAGVVEGAGQGEDGGDDQVQLQEVEAWPQAALQSAGAPLPNLLHPD